jgi:transcriptional regulator with PAS, ATPase and Fis domain
MNTVSLSIEDILKENCIRILDSLFDGILVVDAAGIVIYVNPEYLRIVHITREDIQNKPLRSVRPGAILPDVVRTGKAVQGALRREGDTDYVVDMSPIFMDGVIVGGISVVKDVTEIQRLSASLARFQRNNKQLLNSIRGFNAAKYTFDDIVHRSAVMTRTVEQARAMALSRADILITGESGTGKELFAQAIHNTGPRRPFPFIALNCATLAPNVIESELFGYVEGAFTGALRGGRAGFFEAADGGTLFLDEVTELPVGAQAKLLRALQEKTIRRVGDTNERDTDVRVITAGNGNIREMVARERFRTDLFYRLNALHLSLPPLRERGDDMLLVAEFFLSRLAGLPMEQVSLSAAVMEVFSRHAWPGNIRELRNIVEYAVHMGAKNRIGMAHIPEAFFMHTPGYPVGAPEQAIAPGVAEKTTLAEAAAGIEKAMLDRHLSARGRSLAAKKIIAAELGISLTTLYAKLRKYSLRL